MSEAIEPGTPEWQAMIDELANGAIEHLRDERREQAREQIAQYLTNWQPEDGAQPQ